MTRKKENEHKSNDSKNIDMPNEKENEHESRDYNDGDTSSQEENTKFISDKNVVSKQRNMIGAGQLFVRMKPTTFIKRKSNVKQKWLKFSL